MQRKEGFQSNPRLHLIAEQRGPVARTELDFVDPGPLVSAKSHLDLGSKDRTMEKQGHLHGPTRLVDQRSHLDQGGDGLDWIPGMYKPVGPVGHKVGAGFVRNTLKPGQSGDGFSGGGGLARAIASQKEGGGVSRRHLGGTATTLGGLYEASFTNSPRYEVQRASGTIIDRSQGVHKSGQSRHLISSTAKEAETKRSLSSYLRNTHITDPASSEAILYPEFGIALCPASGEMRSLSRFERLLLCFTQKAPSASHRSVPKYEKATCEQPRSQASFTSRRRRFARSSSSTNG